MTPKETARKLLENFLEAWKGNRPEDDKDLFLELEDYFNTEEVEPDDYGNYWLVYGYERAPLDLIKSQLDSKLERPESPVRCYVVTQREDYKDTMYVAFFPDKNLVADHGWFRYEEEPFKDVEELLEYMAEAYNQMKPKVEKAFGVELEPIDVKEVVKAGKELYEEIKRKVEKEKEEAERKLTEEKDNPIELGR